MIRTIRSELLKMRTMPGMWVVLLLAFPLTCLFILFSFRNAGLHSFPQTTFSSVHNLSQERLLLGSGFRTATLLAPVLGVLCITTEYRHKTITGTLLLTPQRDRVLAAKDSRVQRLRPGVARPGETRDERRVLDELATLLTPVAVAS